MNLQSLENKMVFCIQKKTHWISSSNCTFCK